MTMEKTLDKKIEEAVQKAMEDVKLNKPPQMPSSIMKDDLMKELYDDMLDFRKRSSNSLPTKDQRDAYIIRQNERLERMQRIDTLTSSERIMFLMAKKAMANIMKMPIRK